MLKPEEEVTLAQRIKQWGPWSQEALDKLTKANLRFVVSVAKQYQNQWLSLSDLINEGNLGLIKAAQRFDETKGFKFISYAVRWIRQSILQALAEQSRIVRMPLNKVGSQNKINKTITELEQILERTPSAEEIANILEIDSREVEKMLNANGRHISFDAPLFDSMDSDATLLDFTEGDDWDAPDERLDYRESLKIEIERALSWLNDRSVDIIKLHFGIDADHPMSLEEIGEKFGLTRERVRQIKDKAINRLRIRQRSKLLKTFLS